MIRCWMLIPLRPPRSLARLGCLALTPLATETLSEVHSGSLLFANHSIIETLVISALEWIFWLRAGLHGMGARASRRMLSLARWTQIYWVWVLSGLFWSILGSSHLLRIPFWVTQHRTSFILWKPESVEILGRKSGSGAPNPITKHHFMAPLEGPVWIYDLCTMGQQSWLALFIICLSVVETTATRYNTRSTVVTIASCLAS